MERQTEARAACGEQGRAGRPRYQRTPAWKAVLAVSIAGGALLWHLLACTESPMAFSPSGEQLAFVTMEPYELENIAIKGTHAFRLMVVSGGKDLRVIEQSVTHMLTAPAYSPDGKKMCYLRIPLLTAAEAERIKTGLDKRRQQYEEATSPPADERWPVAGFAEAIPATEPAPTVPATAPATGPVEASPAHALPSMESIKALARIAAISPVVPADLVVRDVATGKVVSTGMIEVRLMGMEDDGKGQLELSLWLTYVLARLQYSANGREVFCWLRSVLVAVDLATGESRIVAAPLWAGALSPDGKTAAVVTDSLAFVRTDGSKTTYFPWARAPSQSGLAWADNATLAILSEGPEDEVVLDFVTTDGRRPASKTLLLPGQSKGAEQGELAIAPDGRHMVISFGKHAYFMTAEGKVLKAWKHEDDLLVQPTFTPDSRRVAMKYMAEGERRATAIVFFTPEGKEVSRVAIHAIPAGTTRPAGRAATVPADKAARAPVE